MVLCTRKGGKDSLGREECILASELMGLTYINRILLLCGQHGGGPGDDRGDAGPV